MKHNKTIKNIITISLLLFITFIFNKPLPTSAWTIAEGEGADTNMSNVNCTKYLHGHVGLCGDPLGSDGGGASWHLYKTSDDPNYPYTILGFHPNIMQSDKRNKITTTCPSNEYELYAIYGWDGRYNKDILQHGYLGNATTYLQYGPIKYTSSLPENTYNALDFNISGANDNDLRKIYSTLGYIPNNTKITNSAATSLYNTYTKDTTGSTKQLADGNIGYFCIKPDYIANTKYFTQSNVSNGGSNWNTTEIVTNDTIHTKKISISAKTGDTVTVAFSHNIFSSNEASNVKWRLRRTVFINGDNPTEEGHYLGKDEYYQITSETVGLWEGFTDITDPNDDAQAKYIANNRENGYLTRDYYSNITFLKAGTYNFCEAIFINGSQYTEVCAEITVKGGPIDQPNPCEDCIEDLCEKWKQYTNYEISTKTTAYNDVISGIKVENRSTWTNYTNYTLSNGDWSWNSNGLDYGSRKGFANNTVYAKPGDLITWHHCYYPGVQNTYKETVTYTHNTFNEWSSPGTYPNTNNNMWNGNKNTAKLPKNSFGISIYKNYFNGTNKSEKIPNFTMGDTDIHKWEDTYTVQSGKYSKAGLTLQEGISSFAPNYVNISSPTTHSMACGKHLVKDECDEPPCGSHYEYSGTCTHGDTSPYIELNTSDPRTNPIHSQDVAAVKIPYNFINSASVSISDDAVYSGESVNVNTQVTVNSRQNNITKGYYVTKIDQSEVRLITYTSNNNTGNRYIANSYDHNICSDLPYTYGNCTTVAIDGDERSGILNNNETSNPENPLGGEYNVYDTPAGQYLCAVIAVYPYTVSGDTDTKDENGNTPWKNNGNNYSWYVSAPDCVKVAKKPNMQVWGNSLYTTGEIWTNITSKHVVDGYYGFTPNSHQNTTVFGSWVEQSIFTPKALIYGFASGAATGKYSSGNNTGSASSRTPKKGLGGSHEGNGFNFCRRSPLTMPNARCNYLDGVAGYAGSGHSLVDTSPPADKSAIIGRYFGDNEFEECLTKTRDKGEDNVATVCKEEGNIGNLDVKIGKVYLYSANGITISGNIRYPRNDDSESGYTSLYEIPKVIIYSKGDITIDCEVERIDAVLIADGNVDTCPYISNALKNNGNITNDEMLASSTQLKIFGTIITDTMTANRTYGAAPGKYSNTPAEIIDYDSSLYLWGLSQANANKTGKLEITYQTELSPRY